jgi:broad specificity phosphatase PhoE
MEQALLTNVCLSANVAFSRIYTTPLSRARDTAACIAAGSELQIESQLQELDTGDVSHITLPELWTQDARFKKPWLSPSLRYPGGETFQEMVCRITNWFDAHSKSWGADETVLIVGHEGTLRSIYMRLLGLQLHEYPDFPIGNCDYLYFYFQDGAVVNHRHVELASL